MKGDQQDKCLRAKARVFVRPAFIFVPEGTCVSRPGIGCPFSADSFWASKKSLAPAGRDRQEECCIRSLMFFRIRAVRVARRFCF